jgi:phage FluMu gp28-like protein
MATGLKRNFEDKASRIPADSQIRRSLHSVKKYATTTKHFRFDAERTDETGHADHFWAKALAVQAGSGPASVIEFQSTGVKREFTRMKNFMGA